MSDARSGNSLDISALSLNNPGSIGGDQLMQNRSRLNIWTDGKSGKQGASSSTSLLHASASTPNLHG